MSINHLGHLEISGTDTIQLAEEFGTPLYVMDEKRIRDNCRCYLEALKDVYPDSDIAYAGKALLNTALSLIIEEEGLSLDVVSGGELFTALKAGFPPERIYFHGNNKSREELIYALHNKVGQIMVDSLMELDTLNQVAKETRVCPRVLLRLTPGVETPTHSYIQTGQEDSKFGLSIRDGAALQAVRQAFSSPYLQLIGFHSHLGSQIFSLKPFLTAAKVMGEFMVEARKETGFTAQTLNLGGGFGLRYQQEDDPLSTQEMIREIGRYVKDLFSGLDYPLPKLMVEPGRAIVGDAGITLYTIGNIKDRPGIRKYVAIDGGMTDNPRVALYQATYKAAIANKIRETETEKVTIAGRCCESGDTLIRDLALPRPEPGDILVVFATGAYNYSMASNYNRLPRPAMVLVSDGQADLIVARETYEQLTANDLIPQRLRGPAKLVVEG